MKRSEREALGVSELNWVNEKLLAIAATTVAILGVVRFVFVWMR